MPETLSSDATIENDLNDVRECMASIFMETALQPMVPEFSKFLGAGQMLRSRIAFRLGPVSGVPRDTQVRVAAAVEMIHAATLLHDDVIDGGELRRHAPTFWVERGVSGAILLGDMLLFKALDLISGDDHGRLLPVMVRMIGEVCQGESEQELVFRGGTADWDTCLQLARRKTGALFAWVANACAGSNPEAQEALTEAGYLAGTAYQLADDLLDARGDVEHAGKTLGTDERRSKTTAATVDGEPDRTPECVIGELLEKSAEQCAPWPEIRAAWEVYLERDLRPSVERHLK